MRRNTGQICIAVSLSGMLSLEREIKALHRDALNAEGLVFQRHL